MAIFKKTDEDEGLDTKSPPTVGNTQLDQPQKVSVIGPTLVFKGELSADEDLIIEGQVEGKIAHHKKHLTIGEQGRVTADINASSVIVLGQLVGNIHSEGTVFLAATAEVKGDIYCSRIVMEDGARFQGNVDMGEPPIVKAVPQGPLRADKLHAKHSVQ